MTNTPEPPIESLLIDMRKRLSAASGWTDKAIAEMPNHVIEHMTSTAREVLAALEPSPESSLIELIEAARFTHELSDTRIAFNKGIDTAIRLIKGRDDLHPSPDWDGLVELLLGLHPHGNMTGMQRDAYGIARSDAISIIRQHMGEKK